MGQKFLIDTNVVIDFSNNKFEKDARLFVEKVINEKPIISFINEIEFKIFNPDKFAGKVKWDEEPLEYQKRVRNEWY